MGSYNIKSIRKKVLKTHGFDRASRNKVNQHLAKARNEMLREFDHHPVTKEISQGVTASNLSKTLSGYGNLFTFIGFDNNSDPIQKVRDLLTQFPRIKSKAFKGDKCYYTISVPKGEDFRIVASMPWESGRNWVEGIESGISGFGYYMADLFGNEDKSRSGKAIQTENKIRSGSYRPTPYISMIVNKMILSITEGK